MSKRVLFVCLGNICRSPTAEAVFRDMAAAKGLGVTVDSAGTSAWHIAEPPYEPMQNAAHRRGYDLSALRARQFVAEDFDRFDLIIVMDRANLLAVNALRPTASLTPVERFLDYGQDNRTDVPDPYYTRDFDLTLDLVEQASAGLIAYLQ